MDGWNTTFLLGPGLFSGAFAVSFTEGICHVWMSVHSTQPGQTILMHSRLEDLNRSVTSLALLNMRFMQVWMTAVVSGEGSNILESDGYGYININMYSDGSNALGGFVSIYLK